MENRFTEEDQMSELPLIVTAYDAHVQIVGTAYPTRSGSGITTIEVITHGYDDPILNGLPVLVDWMVEDLLLDEDRLLAEWRRHRGSRAAEEHAHTVHGIQWIPATHPDGPVAITPSSIDLDDPDADRWWLATTHGDWAITRHVDTHLLKPPGEGWLVLRDVTDRLFRAGGDYSLTTTSLIPFIATQRWETGTVIACGTGRLLRPIDLEEAAAERVPPAGSSR
jgi:hypothetical protein